MSYSNAVILLCTALTVGMSGKCREWNSGSEIVQIAPRPQSPNCVSSLDQNPAHKVVPMHQDLTERDVLARLRSIIETMPRTKIVQYTARYLRAEFLLGEPVSLFSNCHRGAVVAFLVNSGNISVKASTISFGCGVFPVFCRRSAVTA
jgi:hypothetical protein